MTARIGSLFSGIGGLELGLERAGVGRVAWQVEIDPFCREVLAKHWPEVTRHDDVRSVGATNLDAVDVICGGFPCQDVSSAGKRIGLAGARSGLWFEYLRIVRELAPQWVVVENVASGARAWVDVVVEGLGELGYASLPVPLAAADVGAPHERARVFIVAANTHEQSQPASAQHAEVAGAPALAPDAERKQLRQQSGRFGGSRRLGRTEPAHDGWSATQPDMVRVVHGVPRGVDSRRVKALGNAVVPQCAEVIGHVIRQLMGSSS